jgi:hypothetical protein
MGGGASMKFKKGTFKKLWKGHSVMTKSGERFIINGIQLAQKLGDNNYLIVDNGHQLVFDDVEYIDDAPTFSGICNGCLAMIYVKSQEDISSNQFKNEMSEIGWINPAEEFFFCRKCQRRNKPLQMIQSAPSN